MRDPPEQRAANRGGTILWLRADSYDQGARVRPGREGTTRAWGYDQSVGILKPWMREIQTGALRSRIMYLSKTYRGRRGSAGS